MSKEWSVADESGPIVKWYHELSVLRKRFRMAWKMGMRLVWLQPLIPI